MSDLIPQYIIKRYVKERKIGSNIYYFALCPCCDTPLGDDFNHIVGFKTKKEAIKAFDRYVLGSTIESIDDTFHKS